jgi:hypothetical protein
MPNPRAYNWRRRLASRRLVGLVRRMGGGAMSRARTWSVRLSVDELNASICLLETDAEMAAWARGLMRGLNAGDNKPGASDPYSEGWHVGRAARQKADDLRAQLSENGGSDKEANATANAPAFGKANAPANALPIGEPERRTNNEEQGTKNKERKASAPRAAFDASMFDEMLPVEFACDHGFVSMWHDWVGERKARKTPMTERAAKMHLEALLSFGSVESAIESMRQAIEKHWTMVYKPKEQLFGAQPAKKRELASDEFEVMGMVCRHGELDNIDPELLARL